MNTTTAAIVMIAVLVAVLAIVHVPFGDYMARVYTSRRHLRVERGIYRLVGVDRGPRADLGRVRAQRAGLLRWSPCCSSTCSSGCRRTCRSTSASPTSRRRWPSTPPPSFVTNTNWQAYSGESTMGHLVQMAGLAVQNFASAAVGMAVAIALVRGFAPGGATEQLGNFWVDLTRTCVRILLPIAVRRRDRVRRGRHGAELLRRHRR